MRQQGGSKIKPSKTGFENLKKKKAKRLLFLKHNKIHNTNLFVASRSLGGDFSYCHILAITNACVAIPALHAIDRSGHQLERGHRKRGSRIVAVEIIELRSKSVEKGRHPCIRNRKKLGSGRPDATQVHLRECLRAFGERENHPRLGLGVAYSNICTSVRIVVSSTCKA